MSKREKLRRKLRDNPKGRTKQEIETLLDQFGFLRERVRGSHHTYVFEDGKMKVQVIIPFHGQKVKPAYVKLVTELLDQFFPEVESEDDEQ